MEVTAETINTIDLDRRPALRDFLMIQTIYEDGYSWVEIDDAAWARATQIDWFDGYPIPFNNNQHRFH